MRFTVSTQITAHTGVYATTDQHGERLSTFLGQLMPLSGRCLIPADRLCTAACPSIRHIPTFSGEIELDETASAIYQAVPVAFLEFTAEIDVDESAAFESMILPKADEPRALRGIAERRLDEAIAALGLATYLAMPREIMMLPINRGRNVESSVPSWGQLGGNSQASVGDTWPPLHRIPLARVLDWLDGLPGWQRGIGENVVARGVAALSQALAEGRGGTNSATALMWSMIGLEALYCREREGLRSQLLRNADLFLGPMHGKNRKRFGKVYDYRSSFVHGGLDLPFAHREKYSPHDEVWRFIWDSDEEAGLAFTTLLATVQQLILRDSHALDFVMEVRLSGSRSANEPV